MDCRLRVKDDFLFSFERGMESYGFFWVTVYGLRVMEFIII